MSHAQADAPVHVNKLVFGGGEPVPTGFGPRARGQLLHTRGRMSWRVPHVWCVISIPRKFIGRRGVLYRYDGRTGSGRFVKVAIPFAALQIVLATVYVLPFLR